MDFTVNARMTEYYEKFIELQEKLRKSEEERLKLEMKFNEMVHKSREEEQTYYRKLRAQYKKFLEEDRKRQERNEKIVRTLERIETRIDMLTSKTERFKNWRRHYNNYLQRFSDQSIPKIDPTRYNLTADKSLTNDKYNEDDSDADKQKMNDEKMGILDKYLESISSQKSKELLEKKKLENAKLDQLDALKHRINDGFDSNKAQHIAEDIMNSIYSRHYNKDPNQDEKYSNLSNTKPNKVGEDIIYSILENSSQKPFVNTEKSHGENDSNIKCDAEQKGIFVEESHELQYIPTINTDIYPAEKSDVEKNSDLNENYVEDLVVSNIEEKVYQNVPLACEADDFVEVKKLENTGDDKFMTEIIEAIPDISSHAHSEMLTQHESFVQAGVDQGINNEENIVGDRENKEITEYDQNKQPGQYNQNEQPLQYDENNQPIQYDENLERNPQCDDIGKTIEHDEIEQPIQYDENVQQPIQYDENGQHILYDENGQPIHYDPNVRYDENGQPIKYDPNVQYDKNEQPIHYDPNVQYDENGQPIQYDPNVEYDESGQPIHYDENGQQIQYDQNGQQIQYYTNGQQSENDPSNVQYYETRQPIQYGQSGQSIQYDQSGEPIQYDANGQPIYFDQSGQRIQYDENGQVIQFDGNGQPIYDYTEYDENGQSLRQFDENGQPFGQYDEKGQPLGQYDENGQPLGQYNKNGQPLRQYGENGQPIHSEESDQLMEKCPESQGKSEVFYAENSFGDVVLPEGSTEVVPEGEPVNIQTDKSKVLKMLDTDTESLQQNSSKASDNDFSISQ